MMARFILFLMIALLALGTAARAEDLPPPQYARINLYPSVSQVLPGKPFTLVIEQIIAPDWHTYWKNPGDSGTPTVAKWNLPDGGTAGDLRFPTPSRIPYGDLMNFGYSGRALFQSVIVPPETLANNSFTVNLDLEWLACKDICVPEGGTYKIVLAAFEADPKPADPKIAKILHEADASAPQTVQWKALYDEFPPGTKDNFRLMVWPDVDQRDLFDAGKISFFPEEWGLFVNHAEQKIEKSADGAYWITVKRGERKLSEIGTLHGVLRVEDKQGNVKGFALQAQSATPPAQPIAPPEPTQTVEEVPDTAKISAPKQDHQESGIGLLAALFFALLGGLILNLMPCVFPVLSLKVLSLSQLSGEAAKKIRLHGWAYAIGVILSFVTIAGALITLQTAGAAIGWGFQLQQPVVVTLLAWLFALIGFNLMGWFEVDIARFLPKRAQQVGDGLVGSFATGMLATIVATPCTAPFMAAAMGFALTQNAFVALLVFGSLGLGLALPFLILCYAPALLRPLPRPGHWMVTFRECLAFPMFLAAIWLLWVLAQQTGATGAAAALCGVLVLAFILWLSHHRPKGKITELLRTFAFVLSVMSLIAIVTAQQTMKQEMLSLDQNEHENVWSYSEQAFEEALQGDDPIFVNMTAAWCITCKVNERLALNTDATRALFKARNVLYFKGDWTNRNAEITTYLKKFGRGGVPLYVYYGPRNNQTGKRPDPVVLPQLLTEGIIRETFSRPAP